ncbi:MAG: hypothetical protein HQK55_18075, partial [Deltaproteobacteria bacterium]|nr:hypothetical protein [Deltaproteobacteria bacterium]
MSSHPQIIPVEVWPRVLVMGAASPAKTLVGRLAALNIEVVWAGPPEAALYTYDPTMTPALDLLRFAGVAGRFNATIATPDGPADIQAGAVVWCGSECRTSLF